MAAGALALLASPAQAQFSKSYKFLEAVRDKDGQVVTDLLAEPGTQIINTQDASTGDSALHVVTSRRDTTWMSFLMGKGADVNQRNNKGETPLVVASNMAFTEGVQLLVDHGARVDEPNNTGETPLIAAVHRRDVAMMRVLLKAGANPDRSDSAGRSARDYAAIDGKNSPLLDVIVAEARPQSGRKQGSYGPRP
jgi:ankyrin repeat protein